MAGGRHFGLRQSTRCVRLQCLSSSRFANATVCGTPRRREAATLEESPVTLGLGAHGVWEGHSGRSTVHIGPYDLNGEHIDRETRHCTISYGAWKEVEEAIGFVGPTDRAERSRWLLVRWRPVSATALR